MVKSSDRKYPAGEAIVHGGIQKAIPAESASRGIREVAVIVKNREISLSLLLGFLIEICLFCEIWSTETFS
jgi:hypothetical protein